MEDCAFESLLAYMAKLPGMDSSIGCGGDEDGMWWVKFGIDISNPLAWRVVQELGHVLNYLSINDRLPTVFYPVSPPPYMNGGPEDFLSWVIENRDPEFSPDKAQEWLEGRLPRPVDDLNEWDAE
ncbi:MAG: hypothetical protein OER56_10790 [Hyphomicrobiales bacterium]|nr:hypothetical protein [Hyphomicrobiales bacterium]